MFHRICCNFLSSVRFTFDIWNFLRPSLLLSLVSNFLSLEKPSATRARFLRRKRIQENSLPLQTHSQRENLSRDIRWDFHFLHSALILYFAFWNLVFFIPVNYKVHESRGTHFNISTKRSEMIKFTTDSMSVVSSSGNWQSRFDRLQENFVID